MSPIASVLLAILASLLGAKAATAPTRGPDPYGLGVPPRASSLVSRAAGGRITPHWMPDGESFWYAAGSLKDRVILVARPDGAPPSPMLDVERVRALLAEATGKKVRNEGLPFSRVELRGEDVVRFKYRGDLWDLRLTDYELTRIPEEEAELEKRRTPRKIEAGFTVGSDAIMERPSPDGELLLRAEDDDLSLRRAADDETTPLTEDGEKYWSWAADQGCWSPDGSRVAVLRADAREVPRIAVVDWLQESEEVELFAFPRAGQTMPLLAVHVIDVASGERVAVEGTGRPDEYAVVWGWRADGSEVLIGRIDREYKRLDLLAADAETGESRVLLTETSETFIGGLELMIMWRDLLRGVGDGERFVWMSDRSGWRHLYLYDFEGNLLGPITQGEFPVEKAVAVDPEEEVVWFLGHAEEDPYETHLYRCGLDGEGFERLTEGPGTHEISFGPKRTTFVDTYSSPVDPPRSVYRRADGALLLTVAEAEPVDETAALPEKFVVPAADGAAELHGLLYKPRDFDPARKYPILDFIYNGPFTTWVPHSYGDGRGMQARVLAEEGYLVMIVDGRGTTGRGKAFQDVVHLSFGTNEIPDHVSALRALAAERPYVDLDRVGIFGSSWGGYMTVRAMLLAPEVYRAGVAMAPVYDLYDHHATPIEGYMGTPQNNPEAYEAASSLKLAKQLEGHLLLIHGTADVNASFSATMKMTSALIEAGKQHDLVVIPGADHSLRVGGAYAMRAQSEFFAEHLTPELMVPVD